MKTLNLFLTVCLSLTAASFALAQDWEKGPYEQQLRPYSEYHGDVKIKMEEENEKKRLATEQLKVTGLQLKAEHDNLQMDIETKEASVEKLKELNVKLQEAQSVMHEQYVELEELFQEQKSENERLKEELEASKKIFYNKMIEFYQQEDEILKGQIIELQERQKDVEAKVQDIQENLLADQ